MVAGIVLGLGSAWLAVRAPGSLGSVSAGPWHASLLTGSADAGLYTRARVAVNALVALSREETIYFLATRDSAGQALRSRCTYRLTGTAPQARWWSITAYADDMFLFPNAQNRYSISNASARLDAAGRFTAHTGPQQPANAPFWIPTPGDRGLVFTLRLYNPSPLLVASPKILNAPSIERIGDC
jgi:hypothetical protein